MNLLIQSYGGIISNFKVVAQIAIKLQAPRQITISILKLKIQTEKRFLIK